MGGAGGTGKSRVVSCLIAFTKSWNRPNSIVTVAVTGKAASNIQGATIDALFVKAKSEARRHMFNTMDLLIIDECSMV